MQEPTAPPPDPSLAKTPEAVPRNSCCGSVVRQMLLAVFLAALVLLPRAYSMSRSLSETLDEDFHLSEGVARLRHEHMHISLNDPPLGGELGALPILSGVSHEVTLRKFSALHEPTNPWSRDKILMVVAIWKTLLFLPAIGLIFWWLAGVYSTRAAWLGVALLVAEPNFAAHIPSGAIDVIGVEAILFGVYFIWRYFERPTLLRASLTTLVVATAMMMKHTAILLPAVAAAFAVLWWIILPLRRGELGRDWDTHWRIRTLSAASAIVLFPIAIFVLTGFDRSPIELPMQSARAHHATTAPTTQFAAAPATRHRRPAATQLAAAPATAASESVEPAESRGARRAREAKDQPKLKFLEHKFPGGMYYRSILTATVHTSQGHPEFLLGERTVRGWWYYFPVLATYKIPIPIFVLLLLGLLSLIWIRPGWNEWSLAIPMVLWTALMIHSPIDIGFRHFLPPYAFMLLLAARVMLTGPMTVRALAWSCAIATAIHGATFHPDYIAYLNFPRDKPQLAINDSNLDWGQSVKEIRAWAMAHQDGRPIWIRLFYGRDYTDPQTTYYLSNLPPNAHLLSGHENLPGHEGDRPRHGLLIISPIRELAVYETTWLDKKHTIWGGVNPYEVLKPCKPVDVIGHNMAVYDLDQLSDGKGFDWDAPNQSATSPATAPR